MQLVQQKCWIVLKFTFLESFEKVPKSSFLSFIGYFAKVFTSQARFSFSLVAFSSLVCFSVFPEIAEIT